MPRPKDPPGESTGNMTPEGKSSLGKAGSVKHPAIELLDQWLQDDSGYDEAVWPEIRRYLERREQKRDEEQR